jgi:MFS-type transporter involved in bile tolerance (Atg22 family)
MLRMAERPATYPPRAAVVSWIFFDWAAQPYFTLITTFVFAPYFATSVAPIRPRAALWGFATAAAGLVDRADVAGAGRDRRCLGRASRGSRDSARCW